MVWLALTMALPLAAARAQTFLTIPVNLSGTGSAAFPSIAVGPSGDINVVWLDSGAILFRRSVDGGQTFSAAMRVATSNLPSQSSQPQIAVNSAGVYVAWAGTNAGGGGDVFFSSFSGGSWSSPPANVSGGNGIAAGSGAPVPHMAVDPNGGVDIVWGQNGAFFRRFFNGSFSSAVPLTTSAMASQSPRIAINSAGHVFVVWENAGTCPTIMFARSTDGGTTFTPYSVDDTLTLSDGSKVTGCASDVQIAVGGNNTIWLLWANDKPIQDLPITYATDSDSSFSGTNFPETYFENLSGTSSYTPQMVVDGAGDIDVVWVGHYQQNSGPPAIYFSRSTNPQKGGTFCGGPNDPNCPNAPVLTSPSAVLPAGPPQIVAEPSGAMDLLWQQASAANPSGPYDIVLARSTDGMSFSNSTLNTAPTTQGGTGQLATDGSANVYAVWQGSSGSGGDVLLNGDSAGLRASAQFSLNGVKVSVSPASAVINVGGSSSFNLSVSSTNSVSGSLTLACGGAPAGVSCSFNPNPISVPANGSASATLSVSVAVKPSGSAVERNPGEFRRWPGGLPATLAWMWGIGVAAFLAALAAEQRMRSTSRFARVLVLMLLVAIAATGLLSCGGSTSNGGGGGGGSITFPLTLQAQANSGTASMQTISITVP